MMFNGTIHKLIMIRTRRTVKSICPSLHHHLSLLALLFAMKKSLSPTEWHLQLNAWIRHSTITFLRFYLWSMGNAWEIINFWSIDMYNRQCCLIRNERESWRTFLSELPLKVYLLTFSTLYMTQITLRCKHHLVPYRLIIIELNVSLVNLLPRLLQICKCFSSLTTLTLHYIIATKTVHYRRK